MAIALAAATTGGDPLSFEVEPLKAFVGVVLCSVSCLPIGKRYTMAESWLL